MKRLIVALVMSATMSAQAAELGPVIQAFGCSFKDGQGFEQLQAAVGVWNEKLDEMIGDEPSQFFAAVFRPLRGGEPGVDFYMIGASPNLNVMAGGIYNYLTSEAGQAGQAALDGVAQCSSSILLSERMMSEAPPPTEDDRTAAIEGYACTLNPGTSERDVSRAEEAWLDAARAIDAKVDVIKWTPLFANTPVDMWYLVVNDGIREWAQFRTAFSTSEAGAAADARFQEITNCESTVMGARAVRGNPPTPE